MLSGERRAPGKKKPWTTAYIKGFVTFLIETMWWKFKTIAPLKIIVPKILISKITNSFTRKFHNAEVI